MVNEKMLNGFNYHPIPIASWEFIEPGMQIRGWIAEPKQFVLVHFVDGTELLTKRHPTAHTKGGARLYGGEGESLCFFSLSSEGFNEIKPNWNKAMETFIGGSVYPVLRQFIGDNRTGGIISHHAMYEIWCGERDPKCEIHHLNRDKFDWCENNLIQLAKRFEHPNADARQKLIESIVHDLHRLTHARLRELTIMPNNEFLHEVEEMRK